MLAGCLFLNTGQTSVAGITGIQAVYCGSTVHKAHNAQYTHHMAAHGGQYSDIIHGGLYSTHTHMSHGGQYSTNSTWLLVQYTHITL